MVVLNTEENKLMKPDSHTYVSLRVEGREEGVVLWVLTVSEKDMLVRH